MKNFTTMTEYEIINAAYYTVLDSWTREKHHKENLVKDGLDTTIADLRLSKYDAQLRELSASLLEMEREGKHKA